MNPGQRMQMLDDKKRMLSAKNDEYKDLIEKRATAEYEYNVAFAEQLLSERVDGTPITVARELARGTKHVAKLKIALEVCIGIERALRYGSSGSRKRVSRGPKKAKRSCRSRAAS